MKSALRNWIAICGVMLLQMHLAAAATSTNEVKPAQLKVSGFGLLGNRELKRVLKTLEFGQKNPRSFDASFIEDAALILTSRVKRDGYLQPSIIINLTLTNGAHMKIKADDLLENPLPRRLRITKAEFRIRKRLLYHYTEVNFDGLETMTAKEARSYFVETGTLLHTKSSRVYTPEKLERSLANLSETLERAGYENVAATVSDLHRDDKNGTVQVHITVKQGPKVIVHSVREEFFYEKAASSVESRTVFPNKPYSRLWLQDFTLTLKTNQYHRGYPDTQVEIKVLERTQAGDHLQVDLLANVRSGSQIKLGDVSFEGEKKTRDSLLNRRVRIQEGSLLDRIKVEEGRYRLARLGIFDTVDLDYRPVDDHTRDVIYRLKEGKTIDFSLLFGYGSYELLRGGFEVEQFNIWGLAHHTRLKVVQSFKASVGEFTYTIPELVGEDVDVFFNATALRREEISFTREEYGGGVGLHKYFKPISTDVSVRYNYQILRAADASGTASAEGLTNSRVGAIIFDLKHDRRDNPLYPQKGYKIFGTLELASEYLGGDVNYQRLELWSAWHHQLGGGRMLSLGLSHGVVLSIGSTAEDLPFNKRFFPGGENSIRGYKEDEASPRNELGKIVGAESYALGTVEFEQELTPKWSLVVFSDSLGFARDVANYPFDTGLYSVGGGLRWRTIIGPIRVEYGHNLNPRKGDPSGTLHFSLGFPF